MEGKIFDLKPASTKANSDLANTSNYSPDSSAQQTRAEIDLPSYETYEHESSTRRDWMYSDIMANDQREQVKTNRYLVRHPEDMTLMYPIHKVEPERFAIPTPASAAPEKPEPAPKKNREPVDENEGNHRPAPYSWKDEYRIPVTPEPQPKVTPATADKHEEEEDIDLGYDEIEEGPENYDHQKHRLNAFELKSYLGFLRDNYDWPNVSWERQTINDLAQQLAEAEKELEWRRRDSEQYDATLGKDWEEQAKLTNEVARLKKDLEQTQKTLKHHRDDITSLKEELTELKALNKSNEAWVRTLEKSTADKEEVIEHMEKKIEKKKDRIFQLEERLEKKDKAIKRLQDILQAHGIKF